MPFLPSFPPTPLEAVADGPVLLGVLPSQTVNPCGPWLSGFGGLARLLAVMSWNRGHP